MSDTTCKADGCDQPRHQTKTAVYTYCTQHQREVWKGIYNSRGHQAAKPAPAPTPARLKYKIPAQREAMDNVIITDWRNEEIRFGVILYRTSIPMPKREGDRLALLYELERDGWHIVRESVEIPT